MNTGFKDPIAIKGQKPQDKPKDGKSSPWDFRCPHYDQRSSCYVKAGVNYGVGFKSPVGTKGKTSGYSIPSGRVHTLKVADSY